jgi:hypothetical protein
MASFWIAVAIRLAKKGVGITVTLAFITELMWIFKVSERLVDGFIGCLVHDDDGSVQRGI